MSEIFLELVTPEGTLVSQEVQELTAMTEMGEIGILKNHAQLKSKLSPAPLSYKSLDGKVDIVAVLGGVIEVGENKVTVLTDFAMKAEDVDEAQAQKEAKALEAKLQTLSDEAQNSNPDLLMTEINLRKHVICLEASRLQRSRV